jgi:alpha-maltose-1-phosphate synthase
MNIAVLTNEYPPHVYGGAGVHVEYLTRELATADGGQHTVRVLCFGDQQVHDGNLHVTGVQPPAAIAGHDARHGKLFATLLQDLVMAGALADIDIVHCHTWYTHFAGCLVRHLQRVPLVLTTHSLEPHRPWKVEQLGSAYEVSSWIERIAYERADGVVAVSQSMKRDVQDVYGVTADRVRVIHNGIDLTQYRPSPDPSVLTQHGIDPAMPYVLFVGRITRQKGIIHLVNAIKHFSPGLQVVLCAGAPDTVEIGEEMAQAVERARGDTARLVWIREMLPKPQVITLYTHAAVFVCPSVYEPFGIINLEAMACETPVVASAVGGIPEVVEDGATGVLVPIAMSSASDAVPARPEQFSRALADAVNRLMADDIARARMGAAARQRVEQQFSWTSIAARTLEFYREVIARR